jgi:hypothetical protein
MVYAMEINSGNSNNLFILFYGIYHFSFFHKTGLLQGIELFARFFAFLVKIFLVEESLLQVCLKCANP